MTIVRSDKLRDWHSDKRGRGSKCQIFCGRHRRTDRNGFLSSDRNRTICLFYAYFTASLDDRVGVNSEGRRSEGIHPELCSNKTRLFKSRVEDLVV